MAGAADFEWEDLRYFLVIHREGSLTAAARRLRVDPTTVGRRLQALEGALGVRLFVRRRGGWVLTPAGARVVPSAEQAEAAAVGVARIARGAQEPQGRVRLTTAEVLATHLIAPRLPAFHARHPQVRLDLLCTDQVLDLRRGEADLALRLARPTEPDLVARRLARATQRPYAARTWLAERGLDPETLTSLEGREVLTLLSDQERRWSEGLGQVQVVLRTTSPSTLHQATLAGAGVGLLVDAIAATDPRLVPLTALGVCLERPLWLVLHRDLATVARVRVVADFLIDHFATHADPSSSSSAERDGEGRA